MFDKCTYVLGLLRKHRVKHVRGKVREPSIFEDTPARPFRNLAFEDVVLDGETSPRVIGR